MHKSRKSFILTGHTSTNPPAFYLGAKTSRAREVTSHVSLPTVIILLALLAGQVIPPSPEILHFVSLFQTVQVTETVNRFQTLLWNAWSRNTIIDFRPQTTAGRVPVAVLTGAPKTVTEFVMVHVCDSKFCQTKLIRCDMFSAKQHTQIVTREGKHAYHVCHFSWKNNLNDYC